MFDHTDLLHDIIETVKKIFGGNVFTIGAQFEADHQLAAFFVQNLVNYIYTDTSDLSVLGCNII